jgi:hypothetical protein
VDGTVRKKGGMLLLVGMSTSSALLYIIGDLPDLIGETPIILWRW